METLTIFYLIFTFLGFYYLFLFNLIFFQNRKNMLESFEPIKEHSLSIVVPCYNGENIIATTIKNLLKSDYKGLKKVIAVDDCSTDNSYTILKKLKKKYSRLLVVQTLKNSGCAAGAKNYGAKFVNTELIGFTDDDSYPSKNAISKMIGFFNDPKIGAVTSKILVKNRTKFLARLQSIEYKIIAFTRKLFGFIDSIYVTNGPLSIYRKKAFNEVNGFDEQNLTEDIEITWNFISRGWKIQISLNSIAYTIVPEKFKDWLKQRLRWNMGGIQTLFKYKYVILKKGMLGFFILPYFVTAWILAIFGLGLFTYRISRYFLIKFLIFSYSVETQTTIMKFNDIQFSPTILLFFGIILLSLGIFYNLIALSYSKKEKEEFKKENVFNLITYMFIYLLFYPIVLLCSMYKFITKNKSW
jgi:cellulose synthase/poly-beta-1,6-N-acetylglucosamine synthase-like glycosyltransferase